MVITKIRKQSFFSMVENHLAKVDVASSNLVSRSLSEPLICRQGPCCLLNLSDLITLIPFISKRCNVYGLTTPLSLAYNLNSTQSDKSKSILTGVATYISATNKNSITFFSTKFLIKVKIQIPLKELQ